MGNQLCHQCCILQKNIQLNDIDDHALQQYKTQLKMMRQINQNSQIVLSQQGDEKLQPYHLNEFTQSKNSIKIHLNQSTHLSNLTQSKKNDSQSKHNPHNQNLVKQIILPDGTIFKGQTIKGIPNGKGTQKYRCGDYYQGNFKDGLKHGYGVYFYSGEGIYKGNFSQGNMDGYGQFQFENGDVYKGQFKNNQKHGFGKYYCKQGHYQGMYQRGHRCGKGKIKCKHHQVEGIWQDNKILIDHVLVPYECKNEQLKILH